MDKQLLLDLQREFKKLYKGNGSFPEPLLFLVAQNREALYFDTKEYVDELEKAVKKYEAKTDVDFKDNLDRIRVCVHHCVSLCKQRLGAEVEFVTFLCESTNKDSSGKNIVVAYSVDKNLREHFGVAQIIRKTIFGFEEMKDFGGAMPEMVRQGLVSGMKASPKLEEAKKNNASKKS